MSIEWQIDMSLGGDYNQAKMQLFGTSGIRRVADKSLFQLALKVGLAVGQLYGDVVVGADTRTSSSALKHVFISGLLMAGSRCRDIGVAPTPTLALAAGGARAGAMITASHNPPEYNGIKLLNPDGSAFDEAQRQQLESMVQADSQSVAPWTEIETSGLYSDAVEQHLKHIARDFQDDLKLKVVLDCGGGAASVITPHLLRSLGCEVIAINCYPTGFFPRPGEPTETNLRELIRATADLGADLGIAHDGDADRMMAVDDSGRFIPGDKLLALFAQQTGAKEVVTTTDASMVIEEMGFTVKRTKVGDTYVSEALKKRGDFGGEPSGSWVFPASSLCADGIYAAARLVAIAASQKLTPLVDSIPSYPLLRGSLVNQGLTLADLEKRLLVMEPLSVSNTDGIKLIFADGWLLVRISGTEPKIRVTAEAKDEARTHQLYDSGVSIIEACFKNKGNG